MKLMLEKLSDFSRPHKEISIMLDGWVQRNFKTEGGNVGGWEAIRRQGRILQDSGRLRLSFLPFSSRKNAGIGSDLSYSEVHEKGLGPVAKRRMLPRSDDVRQDILRRYNKHISQVSK